MGLFLTGPGIVYWRVFHPYSAPGDHTVTTQVNDGDGGVSEQETATARVNHGPEPSISIVTPADGARYKLDRVIEADYACSDDVAATLCQGPVADGDPIDTSTVGPHSFQVQANDADENEVSLTHEYDVVYPFRFVRPTRKLPDRMTRTAGSNQTIWFTLGGDRGAEVYGDVPWTTRVDCSTGDPMGPGLAAGTLPLAYDADLERYGQVWRTRPGWAGTCRTFTLRLDDGTSRSVLYRFKAAAEPG
jgi:hypothetical protein